MKPARILGASFSAPVAAARPADAEAGHPDRAHYPRDRGLQDLRRRLPHDEGRPGRRPARRSRSISSSEVNINGAGATPARSRILVLIFVTIVAHLRDPADRAGAGRDARGARGGRDSCRGADRACRGSDRGGGPSLMAADTPVATQKPVVEVPSRSLGRGAQAGRAMGCDSALRACASDSRSTGR